MYVCLEKCFRDDVELFNRVNKIVFNTDVVIYVVLIQVNLTKLIYVSLIIVSC